MSRPPNTLRGRIDQKFAIEHHQGEVIENAASLLKQLDLTATQDLARDARDHLLRALTDLSKVRDPKIWDIPGSNP